MPKYVDIEFLSQFPHWENVVKELKCAPAADVQEVKHGKWKYCGRSQTMCKHTFQCSECLRIEFVTHKSKIKDYPYCHCGAKMDGDDHAEIH